MKAAACATDYIAQVAAARSSRRVLSIVSKASPFVMVEPARPAALLRARLANGVESEFGNVESSACPVLLGMLAALHVPAEPDLAALRGPHTQTFQARFDARSSISPTGSGGSGVIWAAATQH